MKRAMVDGASRIFQLAPCFRNGGENAPWHNPEFTMLEWYCVGDDFKYLMDETEDLLRATWQQMFDSEFRDLLAPCIPDQVPRISVYEAFSRYANIELIDGDPELPRKAKHVLSVRPDDDFETAYFKILIEKIEPELAKLGAAFIYDYPPSQAVLSKIENGRAKRFEMYLGRVELCNAFFELLDADDNRQRFEESAEQRKELGKKTVPIDETFLHELQRGMPPCMGNALGFDRLGAVFLGDQSLDRFIPYRFME
jgi:lysyl-tRNA synthetase class 2